MKTNAVNAVNFNVLKVYLTQERNMCYANNTASGNRFPYGETNMKRTYIKEDACISCHLCEVFCRLKHSRYDDPVKAHKKESPRPLARVRLDENGAVALSVRCQHCTDAACSRACLTGALHRDLLTGLIMVDDERCIGCGTCSLVCPLGVPQIDEARGKMVKCELCQDVEIPFCVANCPNEALIYAEIREEATVVTGADHTARSLL